MFRQEEVFVGGWHEKTIDAMQKRRFELSIAQLPPLGAQRLDALSPSAFERRLEQSWQEVERKPMRAQQMAHVWKRVLSSMDMQSDCLSREEHELVERALILGGSVCLEDAQELDAARALSLRLWASVGILSGKPYLELETPVLEPVARAFAREEHEQIRQRLEGFRTWLTGSLYRLGAMDDRQPQQLLMQQVFPACKEREQLAQLARRYLWASCDCVDYSGGVMLLHSALAEPRYMIASARRRLSRTLPLQAQLPVDILPEEIPLSRNVERVIAGALRDGYRADEVVRNLRFLCKQGAPLRALEEVLQSTLIVYVSTGMRAALANMYYGIPKWIESDEQILLQ